jgi:Cupin-like domain
MVSVNYRYRLHHFGFAALAAGSVVVALISGRDVEAAAPNSLLSVLTAREFSPDSTTPIPISTVSVWMKRLLSQDETLPGELLRKVKLQDTIAVAPVRDWLNAERFKRVVLEHCGNDGKEESELQCNVNEVDAKYGLTAMHVAAATGDEMLVRWLAENGGDPDAMDTAGRKPMNLSYTHFISNSKKWARAAGRTHCDLPEVVFSESASEDELKHSRSEVRRLVSEGEPILLRGVLRHYAPQLLTSWSIEQFIAEHGDVPVTVGAVPYAAAFHLDTSKMTLKQYYDRFVQSTDKAPLYVFERDASVNQGGYAAVLSIVRDMFPIPFLIADPDSSGGLDGIHFYLGRPSSGAPFHIHADAANLLVKGSKRWFVYTPARTLYSRTPIQEWIDTDYKTLTDEDKPLECIQEAGDMVYVPLDWGHAVVNLEENTFGFALELLNKRDTYYNLQTTGKRSEILDEVRDEL